MADTLIADVKAALAILQIADHPTTPDDFGLWDRPRDTAAPVVLNAVPELLSRLEQAEQRRMPEVGPPLTEVEQEEFANHLHGSVLSGLWTARTLDLLLREWAYLREQVATLRRMIEYEQKSWQELEPLLDAARDAAVEAAFIEGHLKASWPECDRKDAAEAWLDSEAKKKLEGR